MNLANFDLSVIYTRDDGSYVINQGTYHVPNEGVWAELYTAVKAYADEHPELVQPEPTPTFEIEEPSDAEKATNIINNTMFEYAKHVYPYTDEEYAQLIKGGMYAEFDESAEYPDGWLVLYEGQLYRLTAVTEDEVEQLATRSTTNTTFVLGRYKFTLVYKAS